ncbi:three-helix bundle dimerization domain-containing protein [Pseudarthrobacter sp. NS4]|uniref:three-helix bundle dimerization domain-containing protein n=1 Tax=Pseudarthrobacter sp. NS4 TaxID=2973976 RepID=UPI002163977C|nr:hypothetical protein [Pseudarthrobacter sp. NS4]
MLKKTETQALTDVVNRLAERFPGEPRSVIEDLVAHEHSLFDESRVRDYIPILVERAAKLRLVHRQLPVTHPEPLRV